MTFNSELGVPSNQVPFGALVNHYKHFSATSVDWFFTFIVGFNAGSIVECCSGSSTSKRHSVFIGICIDFNIIIDDLTLVGCADQCSLQQSGWSLKF